MQRTQTESHDSMGWTVAGMVTDVAEHFQEDQARRRVLEDRRGRAPHVDTSVAGLLAVVVHQDQPERDFPDRRRRLTGKQNVRGDIGLFLGRLQRQPDKDWFSSHCG